MNITIPDRYLIQAGMSEEELKIEIAVIFYEKEAFHWERLRS